MAKTQEAQFSYTVQDQIGVKAAITEYLLLDPAMTVAQLVTAWQDQEALLAAVVDGGILSGKAALVLVPSGGPGSPTSGSRVEQTGLFTFANASNPRSFGQDIASFASSKLTGGKINLADADVAALLTALTTPASLSEFTTNQFLVLSALRFAALTFRKHRRAERALSGEI